MQEGIYWAEELNKLLCSGYFSFCIAEYFGLKERSMRIGCRARRSAEQVADRRVLLTADQQLNITVIKS